MKVYVVIEDAKEFGIGVYATPEDARRAMQQCFDVALGSCCYEVEIGKPLQDPGYVVACHDLYFNANSDHPQWVDYGIHTTKTIGELALIYVHRYHLQEIEKGDWVILRSDNFRGSLVVRAIDVYRDRNELLIRIEKHRP